jgi:uncharacterized protein YcfJ
MMNKSMMGGIAIGVVIAAAGGYAGNKVQQNMQAKDTYTTVEKRCRSVNESKVQSLGYDVSYQLAGDQPAA